MADFKYTRRAINDVNELIEYIARYSPYAADDFANQLVAKFRTLAEAPRMGREREEFGAGIRMFPFGNYVIFCRLTATGVLIVRVLHGARDREATPFE